MFFPLLYPKASLMFRPWVFEKISQFGPQNAEQVESLCLGFQWFLKTELITLLITFVEVAFFLLVEYLLGRVATILVLFWLFSFVMFSFFLSPFVNFRFYFKSPNLLDIYRRNSYGKYYFLYTFIGAVIGLVTSFLITKQPGIISGDVENYHFAVLLFGGMAMGGPGISLLHVFLAESGNAREVKEWIDEWQKHMAFSKDAG